LAKSFVERSSNPYDNKVVGIISTNPYSEILGEKTFTSDEHPMPVALAGQAPVKVSTENGVIEPGDPLTSSSTPGVAMKAIESGPIVGKALEGTDGNTPEVCRRRNPTSGVEEEVPCGKIMVFVSVGWYVAPIEDVGSQMSDLSNINVETLTAGTVNTQVLFVGDVKFSMNTDGSLEIAGNVKLSGDLTARNLIVLEEVKAPKITAKEVNAEKINVATPPAEPDGKNNASVGTGTIVAGQTSVVIETTALTAQSKVFVTATTSAGGQSLVVSEKKPAESFTVTLDHSMSTNIQFDWFLIN
jgi:hypothetical protein